MGEGFASSEMLRGPCTRAKDREFRAAPDDSQDGNKELPFWNHKELDSPNNLTERETRFRPQSVP